MASLTALKLKTAKPGRYSDGEGLQLLVKPTGARSWVLRVQVNGKRRDIGLGAVNLGSAEISIPLAEPVPLIAKRSLTLAEARELSRELRAIAKAGRDPVEIKASARAPKIVALTFQECAERLYAELLPSWSNPKHAANWLTTVTSYAFPSLGSTPVDEITAPMVREALIAIWLAKPETARRLRQRIRQIIGWGAAQGMRDPLDLSGLQMPKQGDKAAHFAAMPFGDVPTFIASLSAEAETIGRLALLFAIATAARSGEVRGASWSEIDLTARLWTIPADRMKAKRAHVVPLNDVAMSVLSRLSAKSAGGLVFGNSKGKAISDMTLLKILRDKSLPYTVHGFRSAFKDWSSETTFYSDAVSEAALAHGDPDKVRASYRRTDFLEKRRQQMADWSDFLTGKPAKDSSVTHSEGARMAG